MVKAAKRKMIGKQDCGLVRSFSLDRRGSQGTASPPEGVIGYAVHPIRSNPGVGPDARADEPMLAAPAMA
jgi:hypothetical protein